MLIAGFGWGRPVAVNPYNLRAPSRQNFALVAAAGPFSNLVLALLAAIPLRLGLFRVFDIPAISGITPSLSELVTGFVAINLGLMLFNLIPLVPLDGSKILSGFVPLEWADVLARVEPYGPMILMLILASGFFLPFNILGVIIGPTEATLYHLITGL
jgi:Zn-dependent protease